MSNVFNNKESKVLLLNLQLLEVLGKGKVNEALILQQIDYWTTINKKKNELYIDNEYWLFSSVNQMYERDFKFCFGVDTLKRALVKLEKDGYIITQKHKNGKLYRVNYKKIDEVYNLKTDKNINIKEIKKDKTENQIQNSELGQNAPTINKINYKINIYNNYNNFIKEILSNNLMFDKVKLKLDIDLYDFWFKAIKQDVEQVIANIQATEDSKEYSINNTRVDVASIKERFSSLTEQNINYCTEQILKTKKINIFENYVITSLYNSTKPKNYDFSYNWLED